MFKVTPFSAKVVALASAIFLFFAGESPAQRRSVIFWTPGGWGGGGAPYFPGGGYPYAGGGYYSPYNSGYYAPYNSGYYSPYNSGYYSPQPYYYTVPSYNFQNWVTPPTTYFISSATTQSISPAGIGYQAPTKEKGSIEVRVPAEAKLWFDGQETFQKGTDRLFASPPLDRGKTYTYELRATWTNSGGTPVTRTQEVQVEAGKRATVSFFE